MLKKPKIKKYGIIVILFFLFLVAKAGLSFAVSPILRLDFTVENVYPPHFKLINVKAMNGTYEDYFNPFFPYTIKLVSKDNELMYKASFDMIFLIMFDIPLMKDKRIVSAKIPYYGNNGILKIDYLNQTIFFFDMSNLCNNDGQCLGFEDKFICPSDCDPDFYKNTDKRISFEISSQERQKIITEQIKTQNLIKEETNNELSFVIILLMLLFLSILLTFKIYLYTHKKALHRHKQK